MNAKQIATLQALAARSGRVVNVTRAPGDVLRVVVSTGHGPTVHYVIMGDDPPLRIDPPCPAGHNPSDWTALCHRATRVFEPLLADALGMPARGRMTRHLARLEWVQPGGVHASNGFA